MRIELLFELKFKQLPKDNKSIWISYLKKVLTDCNGGKFFDRYFSDSKAKDYSFSVILPKPEFSGDKIILDNASVKMIFSAYDRDKTGLIFYSAFIADKNKRFLLRDGNAMTLRSVREIREQTIVSSKVIFKTVTGGGLVIRDHERETNRDRYYTPGDEKFLITAKKILKTQAVSSGFDEKTAEEINIIPLEWKKVVVRQYGVYIDVTVGTFLLEGDPGLLQYFYQAGIGSKHSMGYGLLDIVSQI